MSGRRWIRLDVGWDDTEWLAMCSSGAQLAWVKLLCHAKRDGTGGRCKALSNAVAARRWGVTPSAVGEMIEAARSDGAVHEDGGYWTITAWSSYQMDWSAADRQRRFREKHRDP